jgi:hypothetical protein
MTDALGARAIAEFGPDQGADIIELARAFMPAPAARPPSRRRPIFIPAAKSDAEKAGRAEIVRRAIAAVAPPDDPELPAKAADVIAALKVIAPRNPVESGLAGLFVAMEHAAFYCLAGARIAGFDSPMGMVLLGRAEKLTCRAIELAEALARQRNRGQQTIRIEHVTVEQGANALIGNVAAGGRRG